MSKTNLTINDIFNEMIFERKVPDFSDIKINKLRAVEKEFSNPVQKHDLLEKAVEVAGKCQDKWKTETCLTRSMALHKISKHFVKYSPNYMKKQILDESESSLLINYFDTFSDLALQIEDIANWEPVGIVYLKQNENSPLFFVVATIAAAVAAGCCVVTHDMDEDTWFSLFLSNIFKFEGLPNDLINLVAKSEQNLSALEKVNKVVCYGNYIPVQYFYISSLSKSFSFLCPNNTSAIILEQCDISAAVNKIFSETWGRNLSNMWGVSTVVVQEAISQKFFDKLKIQINQFKESTALSSLYKNKTILEKINKTIAKAAKAGATVIQSSLNEGEWGPTALINYQDQNIDLDVPVLKILLCRTSAEGVALLNNTRFSLGTSVWCENSSQALEVASKLICRNVWINCHGVIEPGVPMQPSGSSGNFVINGKDGILEFITLKINSLSTEKYAGIEPESVQKINVWNSISSSQIAFTKWRTDRNRKKYLIEVATAVEETKNYSNLADIFRYCACVTNMSDSLGNTNLEQFSIIFKREPVGVIAVVINSHNADLNKIVSFITPALAFGNTIILVFHENNLAVKFVNNCLKSILPINVVNVVIGLHAVADLASSSVIQAIWFYDTTLSSEYLQKIKNHASPNLKTIWAIPKDISKSLLIIRKECTKSKIIWMVSIDQFPKSF